LVPKVPTEQFFDFILSHPVMLIGVEHGNQDIKVRQQVLQGDVLAIFKV
jgi:hypothetical protein